MRRGTKERKSIKNTYDEERESKGKKIQMMAKRKAKKWRENE